ncbi:MAG: hypothetical protein RLZZ175_825 [Bacteroidota bacterium]|jgi:tRNA1Val (adenine37-N6)-methyltransferase
MFRFKQFTIHQDACAMKVCTDSCLFGALLQAPSHAKNALDIGTGTGLLSLMFAQKFPNIKIDALEIDKIASKQALENVSQSVFNQQINIINKPIQAFESEIKYDYIFSNPPFYENSLKGENLEKNKAHHCSELSFEELCISIKKLLAIDGEVAILLPTNVSESFVTTALENGLYLHTKIAMYARIEKPTLRYILLLSNKKVDDITENQIIIYESNTEKQTYTADFIDLLKDYYLYLG